MSAGLGDISKRITALTAPTIEGADLLAHLTVWRTADGTLVTATHRAAGTDPHEIAGELRDAADTIEGDW